MAYFLWGEGHTFQMWEVTVMYPFFCGQTPKLSLHLHGSLSLGNKCCCEVSGFLTNAIIQVQGFYILLSHYIYFTHEGIRH